MQTYIVTADKGENRYKSLILSVTHILISKKVDILQRMMITSL